MAVESGGDIGCGVEGGKDGDLEISGDKWYSGDAVGKTAADRERRARSYLTVDGKVATHRNRQLVVLSAREGSTPQQTENTNYFLKHERLDATSTAGLSWAIVVGLY